MYCSGCDTEGKDALFKNVEIEALFGYKPYESDFAEAWLCGPCVDGLSVSVGNSRHYQPATSLNPIRERWQAEQKAKRLQKLQEFLERKKREKENGK